MPARKRTSTKINAPALTARERRANREGWGSTDLACRESQAKALRILRAHYRKAAPQMAGRMILACKLEILHAIEDLSALDDALKNQGHTPRYMEDFADFHSDGALQALHFLALHSIKAKPSPIQKAYNESGELAARGKLILHRIREGLRDGWTADQAIARESENIASIIGAGQSSFLVDLGQIVKDWRRNPEKFKRTNTDWLMKIWLPLCLWECPADGTEAEQRCRDAAEIVGLPMISFGEFLNAWRNVRSRVMKSKIPT